MNAINHVAIEKLRRFFNNQPQDIIVCTANKAGEPNVALMNSSRILENQDIEFEISETVSSPSITFRNIKENKYITFMVVKSGKSSKEYQGIRIYAKVIQIHTTGEKLVKMQNFIKEKFGEEKALEVVATVVCQIKKIRPLIDRGQPWENGI
ncbi:hypothetical protein HPDP_00161 [Candidatus Hepatincola sp. Pdp]